MTHKMTTCSACAEEIAKSARVCPHCGEKQGIKGIRRVLNYAVGIFIGLAILVALLQTSSGTPACDSSTAVDGLKRTFDNSPFARRRGLSAVTVSDVAEKSVSDNGDKRSCTASITLNNTETVPVQFELRYNESRGETLIEVQVKQ